jgi:cobalt-zinc-cadmium efflux system outer membrane protein
LLKDEYQIKLITMQNLLNRPDQQEIILPDSLWYTEFSIDKTAFIDSVYFRNPRLRGLEHTSKALMHKEKEARQSGWPNLTLGIDYIFTGVRQTNGINLEENGQNAIMFPRIGLSLPIFRTKYSANEDEAIANRRAVEYQKENTINLLKEQSEEVYLNFIDAERRLRLYQQQLILAKKLFNVVQSEYTTDRIDLDQLLQVDQQMLVFQRELERAKVDRETAIAFINYLSSKMIGSKNYEN